MFCGVWRCTNRHFPFVFHIVRVFRGLPNAESKAPCVLTIGNFDGVHLGHQALLARMRAAGAARGLSTCVMTFEPHPREYFAPQHAPARISNLRDKLEALDAQGVDRLVVEHFNAHFAGQSPEQFVRNIIVDGLHTHWLLVGDDFRFGAKRAGDFAYLQEAGKRYGFEVERLSTIAHDGIRISSSEVRTALAEGDFERAHTLLGRPFMISGHVVHGMKLGRDLGFPTLNLRIAHRHPALTGIFIVQVHGLASSPLPGVASLGLRPTVDDSGRYLLETHLLDFVGDAYGKLVRVEFLRKLRDEQKYDGLDALQAAIAHDTAQARAFFTQGRPYAATTATGQRDFATSATDRIS